MFFFSSCIVRKGDEQEILQDGSGDFSYQTISKEKINVTISTGSGDPVSGLMLRFWTKSPLDGGEIFLKGVTGQNGEFNVDYQLPISIDSVILELNYVGLPNYLLLSRSELTSPIEIRGHDHDYAYLADELQPNTSYSSDENVSSNGRVTTTVQTIGNYTSLLGVPYYLEDRDEISPSLLSYINASLPEGRPVPTYHPDYLADDAETNLNVTEKADVWMTFVHEGAGYKNIIGFYTYETGNAPEKVEDIEDIYVAFPNASFFGSGGGLFSGDKVYLGRFEKNTSIGFVLLADGWRYGITEGIHQVFSNNELNPEKEEELKQHSVLLYDNENELFLIGFEDQNRQKGSDNDFNDAVFYITANPVEAISVDRVKPIDKPEDDDKDGVSNVYDEFPEDENYAYNYVYPGESSFGTFAFEDQWPSYGDYDFNDLVVDYQFHQYANAKNEMKALKSIFVLKANGAGFDNGFGLELDVKPSTIASVSGNEIHENYLEFNGNGTESGQSNAVLIITDNAHKSFEAQGFINTDPNKPFLNYDSISVMVEFSDPMALNGAGSAPFNPFMIIDKTRGREVHLPGYEPTDLVDWEYFGEGNDNSDPNVGIYYKSKTGLPWAMNLPESFDYPKEGADIRDTYNHFKVWANSNGFSYMDWYKDKAGYRNKSMLYSKD